jgi:hypothetical protein
VRLWIEIHAIHLMRLWVGEMVTLHWQLCLGRAMWRCRGTYAVEEQTTGITVE